MLHQGLHELDSSASTSSSSMTCKTTPRDSMKPLTATRSILWVVALYSVRSMVFPSSCRPFLSVYPLLEEDSGLEPTRENLRRTSGDSSASTCKARRAEEARRWFRRGTSITLGWAISILRILER